MTLHVNSSPYCTYNGFSYIFRFSTASLIIHFGSIRLKSDGLRVLICFSIYSVTLVLCLEGKETGFREVPLY